MVPPDPRIPVTLLPDRAALTAWLGAGGPAAVITDTAPPPDGAVASEQVAPRALHRFGCGCCAGRSAAAVALDRLFQARARGRSPWFDRVAVLGGATTRNEAALALREDALSLARFRLTGPEGPR